MNGVPTWVKLVFMTAVLVFLFHVAISLHWLAAAQVRETQELRSINLSLEKLNKTFVVEEAPEPTPP